ncbi:GDP-mannose-dependent alpha-(1-6)-phosphatidylinositol monomannoside mannosyltransferase [Anaerohalosphaera lusitana]|uniref:GDP-mannose-dependent alpha-(1-6)-phosphatidylinositol monomannoside mannosyltransferase n=1 Tax=Anaerohalosphaera lusitana TaxID=1936003 RepID=A0A1U9NK83_9BACT|nr:glycosyltransferase family 4 protein [Anaerohalosphaera lusitana]AQT68332.1 GDP-mannose-dependent alpha-(1-6)-phosphatidylinositol monomannoside mannosyltransferase [Anaerohalosphaera lusitana]
MSKNNSKRILFLTHYFPPESNAPASRVYEMTKRWVAAGHDVTVLTCAPNVPNGIVYEGYKNKFRQTELIDGINVIRVWSYMAANKGTLRRTLNYLTYMLSAIFWGLFVKKPDVIIATSPQFFCGWAGVWLKRLRRVPFILEIRDIWPETVVAIGAIKNRNLLRLFEWLEIKMYKASDIIVTVGEGYRQKLLERNVSSKKIVIVSNGADLNFFKPSDPDSQLLESIGIKDKFICSFIGTVGMCSGLKVIVDAAKLLSQKGYSELVFLVVGDGAVRQELQAESEKLKLSNIVFTGRRPKIEMPKFIASSDVCLAHLQKKDLFKTVIPSKIFEAAAMAKPIVLGVEGFAAKLLNEAKAGICIEPENYVELADALILLYEDPNRKTQYGQSGYSYVLKNFNRDKLAKDYLNTIECLVGMGK